MNLIENASIIEAIAPAAGGSELAGDYVSLKNAEHVTVLVHINQGNAATVALTLNQAKAVAGTSAKALATPVPIWLTADCASSDLPARQTDDVDFTTSDTLKHKLVAFEVPAEALDVSGGFNCLQVVAGASNAANIIAAQYIVSKRRYGGDVSLIVD